MKNTQRRFSRWRDLGIWEKLVNILVDQVNYEWLILNASYIIINTNTSGEKNGNQRIYLTKKKNQ